MDVQEADLKNHRVEDVREADPEVMTEKEIESVIETEVDLGTENMEVVMLDVQEADLKNHEVQIVPEAHLDKGAEVAVKPERI